MKRPKFTRSFEVVTDLPKPLAMLRTLAHNFRWTWRHETQDLFRSIDKDLWEATEHNPIQVLHDLDAEKAKKLAKDPNFIARLDASARELDSYLADKTWFDNEFPGAREKTTIAYFCAEFGISESLPIYSGGLGILAGDHLKAASDLGLPLVGVGLLYNRGYFRQRLSHDGWQQEVYPQYDFYHMPLKLVRGADENPLRIEVELPDRMISCHIWKAEVGRIPLYLLDSNVLENAPGDQSITDTLYGGDEEMRIRQEMILGIGGMRALRALGIQPTVCHMNEGHAAFLAIERIRQFMLDNHCDYKTARQVVVNGNVFTTHTPVPAGFDVFTPEILKRYMGKTVEQVGMTMDQFLKFGRIDHENEGESFNMAVLAMENANHVNGVSRLHAAVTRNLFQGRWPDYPEDEVPVAAVTNGIHTLTWISRRMAELFDAHLGGDWRRNPADPAIWEGIEEIPDEELWAARENERGDLVRYIRRKMQVDLIQRGHGRTDFNAVGQTLDPRVLTIGFARRFATYKRATLMLEDRERLLALLQHSERPIQIVLAGKSHPRDDGGKKLIQELIQFMASSPARARMVFLEDYDMSVARAMVRGVDLWLNNPRRPMEASGTSGMKVVPNGGINCSVLDGWWDEAYDPAVGFAIGGEEDSGDTSHQDWLDSRALYAILENEAAPKFYHRNEQGVPKEWVRMIKNSIKTLAPQFSTARMVQDYACQAYMPAATAFTRLAENGQQRAREARDWRYRVRQGWPSVRVVKVEDDALATNILGKQLSVNATVELGDLTPDDVSVEVMLGKIGPNRELVETEIFPMHNGAKDGKAHKFKVDIKLDEPGHRGYTVRVRPRHSDVQIPSELNVVVWQPCAF